MTIHRFEPKIYHTTIGPHAPVSRISPGDSVSTTTVDARGMDAAGAQVTPRGNPQTGPFFVEGAEPGDTLGVRFDRLRPNRQFGWSIPVIAPNVLDPEEVNQTAESSLARWEIDNSRRTVTLREPDTMLGRLVLPMQPMVGCFGVAPPGGQAISTATSSRHGGNMDYRGFKEGVTVYFPVFVPGALFHVGDGHAVQGDGEIAGTGVEVSFDLQFTAHLIKGKTIYWPRAETADVIMTVGNARPLDQCVQHATTEMLRWLAQDYSLDRPSAQLLLSQCVRYDLGNMYDPAYTMVCLLSKEYLSAIRVIG
jgi:acetamidase/formamidase